MTDMESETGNLNERLIRGERQALAELFTRYHDRLAHMLLFRTPPQLSSRVDIEDLLQEAYLAAEARIDSYDGARTEHGPFVWIRLITLQTLTDLCRKHLAAQRREAGRDISLHTRIAMPGGTTASMASLLISELTSPSGVAMRAESIHQLESAIENMAEMDREVLALRHFEMLDNTETAAVLDIAPKAASIRYVRAIRRLREIFTYEQ